MTYLSSIEPARCQSKHIFNNDEKKKNTSYDIVLQVHCSYFSCMFWTVWFKTWLFVIFAQVSLNTFIFHWLCPWYQMIDQISEKWMYSETFVQKLQKYQDIQINLPKTGGQEVLRDPTICVVLKIIISWVQI